MGCNVSSKRVIPMQCSEISCICDRIWDKIPEKYLLLLDDNRYIKEELFIKIVNQNIQLRDKIKEIEKREFECCVCYTKNYESRQKIRCKHDICKSCYYRLRDDKCPICRVQIKKNRYRRRR